MSPHPAAEPKGALRGPFPVSEALACGALALPVLLRWGSPPLTSLYTETTALLGWGLWCAWLATRLSKLPARAPDANGRVSLFALLACLGLFLASVAGSAAFASLPLPIAARHAGILAAAVAVLLAGARLAGAADTTEGLRLQRATLIAFVVAGTANAAIATLQLLAVPGWWEPLERSGRAAGQMGQPNLAATQMLWAFAALVALKERFKLPTPWMLAAGTLLMAGVALTGSRTGALACLLLAAWGLLDWRLAPRSRQALVAAPLVLALFWLALYAWQQAGGPLAAGAGLLQKSDPTSSRWRLWQQCAVLLAEHPWLGVGWGQFNFAWTLTPMDGLPRTAGYTFTHSHNLLLQWAVELGLPLTLALVGLLLMALTRTLRDIGRPPAEQTTLRRMALAMLAIVALHSQTEFPLWYLHFLLPTMFLLGLAVAAPAAVPRTAPGRAGNPAAAGLLMALGAALVMLDYRAIADVHAPPPEAPPLEQRLAAAERSVLFGYLAQRFQGTLARPGQRSLAVYGPAVFEMLDRHLLASWVLAHAEAGETDKARFLADRLREFSDPATQQFFAPCASDPQRVQCLPAQTRFTLADFR